MLLLECNYASRNNIILCLMTAVGFRGYSTVYLKKLQANCENLCKKTRVNLHWFLSIPHASPILHSSRGNNIPNVIKQPTCVPEGISAGHENHLILLLSISYSQSNYLETGREGALPVRETTVRVFGVQKQHLSTGRPRKLTAARPWELQTDPFCGHEFMFHFRANECSRREKRSCCGCSAGGQRFCQPHWKSLESNNTSKTNSSNPHNQRLSLNSCLVHMCCCRSIWTLLEPSCHFQSHLIWFLFALLQSCCQPAPSWFFTLYSQFICPAQTLSSLIRVLPRNPDAELPANIRVKHPVTLQLYLIFD